MTQNKGVDFNTALPGGADGGYLMGGGLGGGEVRKKRNLRS